MFSRMMQRNLMAGNTDPVTNNEEEQEEYELSSHDMRRRRVVRKRNLILGGIFLLGSAALITYFVLNTAQSTETVASNQTSANVLSQAGEVATYNSEWFLNAVDIVNDENDIAYFSNSESDQIYKLENGIVTVFVGSQGSGFKDGSLKEAQFASPNGLAISNNNLYIADQGNNRIRKIDLSTLTVSTIAGSGKGNYAEGGFTDGASDIAQFNFPTALVVDEQGVVYITDSGNNAIRVIKDGFVSTLVGGQQGDTDGDNSVARLNNPRSIALFQDDLLLVADTFNNKLKTVNRTNGNVSTFAGSGSLGLKDGRLSEAQFYNPADIIVTRAGNIFVADTSNHSIRVIARGSDSISILTGSGEPGFKDGPMLDALFSSPVSVAEKSNGAILVIDRGNKIIRLIK